MNYCRCTLLKGTPTYATTCSALSHFVILKKNPNTSKHNILPKKKKKTILICSRKKKNIKTYDGWIKFDYEFFFLNFIKIYYFFTRREMSLKIKKFD